MRVPRLSILGSALTRIIFFLPRLFEGHEPAGQGRKPSPVTSAGILNGASPVTDAAFNRRQRNRRYLRQVLLKAAVSGSSHSARLRPACIPVCRCGRAKLPDELVPRRVFPLSVLLLRSDIYSVRKGGSSAGHYQCFRQVCAESNRSFASCLLLVPGHHASSARAEAFSLNMPPSLAEGCGASRVPGNGPPRCPERKKRGVWFKQGGKRSH